MKMNKVFFLLALIKIKKYLFQFKKSKTAKTAKTLALEVD